MITIKEIASRLGLSTTTVSNVIHFSFQSARCNSILMYVNQIRGNCYVKFM